MSTHDWYRIRLAIYLLAFIGGAAAPLGYQAAVAREIQSLPGWAIVLLGAAAVAVLLTIPLLLLFVIGIQAINPFTDEEWRVPTHASNPFHFRNPYPFFHFAAYVMGAGGGGLLISGLWHGPIAAVQGLLTLVGAGMLLVGLRLCTRVYAHKLPSAPQTKNQKPQT